MKISIVTVNYNSSKFIDILINSIYESLKNSNRNEDFDLEVIVVDNNSKYTDYINLKKVQKEFFSTTLKIKIYRLERNYGYAGGVNIGVKLSNNDVVIVLNPDITLDKFFFKKIKSLFETKKGNFLDQKIIAPTILLKNSDIINSMGLKIHLAGYGLLNNLGEKFKKIDNKPQIVIAPHGAALIAYRKTLEDLGPFDPYFFSFLEDLDLGLRAYANKYLIINIPFLILYHSWGTTWGKQLSKEKYYYTERNRLLTLLKDFPNTIIIGLFPYIVLSEIISLVYAFSKGYPNLKMKIIADVLRSYSSFRKRRNFKNNYDKTTIALFRQFFTIDFSHTVLDQKYIKILNKIFKIINQLLQFP